MLIGPVIFLTVVQGIAGVADMKKVGRVGAKALLYFEVVLTIALAIGLIVMNVVKPGNGLNVDPAPLDPKAVVDYVKKAGDRTPPISSCISSPTPSLMHSPRMADQLQRELSTPRFWRLRKSPDLYPLVPLGSTQVTPSRSFAAGMASSASSVSNAAAER